jgi:hypothetical protein
MAASGAMNTWLGNEVQAYSYFDTNLNRWQVITKVSGVIVSYFTPTGEPNSITLYEQPWGQWQMVYTTAGATVNLHSDNRGTNWYP